MLYDVLTIFVKKRNSEKKNPIVFNVRDCPTLFIILIFIIIILNYCYNYINTEMNIDINIMLNNLYK